ncbi:hypothetical protein AJ78_00259 [Emergomyces pasteurianus Ep9510]|uniref:Uncharacterized protein n=1 Tax=Emergomyces pasteurianus Ep9510 TaxID=1447872 RepID=A0A1J9PTN7_9EURO|nr:hypothetical protein AJ78_00259 [Emergomyces pasteurianus Ep9510]
MAPESVVSPGQETRGKKRPAAEVLEGEQRRLAKKFGLLHIAQSIPAPIRSPPSDEAVSTPDVLQQAAADGGNQYPIPVATGPAAVTSENELMQVDETKHRVYIHDLESELAEIEAHENSSTFLRDIEKRVMCVPKSVLGTNKPSANNALVLYRLPSSLSVPEPQDSVRRAIIEARERARENAATVAAENERKETEREREKEGWGMSIGRNGSSLDLLASSTSAMLPSPDPLDLDSPYDVEPMDLDDN